MAVEKRIFKPDPEKKRNSGIGADSRGDAGIGSAYFITLAAE